MQSILLSGLFLFPSSLLAVSPSQPSLAGPPPLPFPLAQAGSEAPGTQLAPASDEAQGLEQPVSGIQQATALVRGLGIARNKGQIGYQTTLWRKAQDVVFLLRRGVPRYEAAQQAGVDARVVDQLLKWGGVAPPEN